MGFHLPGPTKGKVDHLIATYGAERVARPPAAFRDIPAGKALICVVDTVTYETASFCFSAAEMALLNDSSDFRRRTWLVMDRATAEELSKYRTAPAERRKKPAAEHDK
jgi:hypothetical protein